MGSYTREDIENLKKKPVEELSPEEKRLVNLQPWASGESGKPKGPKKGTVQWATRVRRLMEDEHFLKTIVKGLPKDWNDIVGDTPADVIAAALIANLVKVTAKNLNSDEPFPRDVRDAVALLNKIGYGDKVVLEDPDSVFNKTTLIFDVVQPPVREEDES